MHKSRLSAVIAGLRSARGAHPEIDFAGHETSTAKRILGELGGFIELTALPQGYDFSPTRQADLSEFLQPRSRTDAEERMTKPTADEMDLALALATEHGNMPFNMLLMYAKTVIKLGYRLEQTPTQSGTSDENVSPLPGGRDRSYPFDL